MKWKGISWMIYVKYYHSRHNHYLRRPLQIFVSRHPSSSSASDLHMFHGNFRLVLFSLTCCNEKINCVWQWKSNKYAVDWAKNVIRNYIAPTCMWKNHNNNKIMSRQVLGGFMRASYISQMSHCNTGRFVNGVNF